MRGYYGTTLEILITLDIIEVIQIKIQQRVHLLVVELVWLIFTQTDLSLEVQVMIQMALTDITSIWHLLKHQSIPHLVRHHLHDK